MVLSDLIEQNVERLVDEWATFAEQGIKGANRLTTTELRNSAASFYRAIAADMRVSQSDEQRLEKAEGRLPGNSPEITRFALDHAQHRLSQAFTLVDILAEFRASRACVMRLWSEQANHSAGASEEIVRFNEAMDEALNVSANLFEERVGKARDMFLGILGHDMRTPLGAVLTGTHLLVQYDEMAPAKTKLVAGIYSAARRLTGLLDDLLDFTRTRMGQALPVTKVPGRMDEAIGDVVEELRLKHPAADISFVCSGDLYGTWDFRRLAQVVANLGGNAIQHGDRSSPVGIRLKGHDTEVLLTVHNQGQPIPPDALARIFDPLTRGAQAETSVKGSVGLGLYISEQVAIAHGGKIDLRSDATGTTFVVHIPR